MGTTIDTLILNPTRRRYFYNRYMIIDYFRWRYFYNLYMIIDHFRRRYFYNIYMFMIINPTRRRFFSKIYTRSLIIVIDHYRRRYFYNKENLKAPPPIWETQTAHGIKHTKARLQPSEHIMERYHQEAWQD